MLTLFYKMDKGGPGYHQTGAGRLRISARHVRLEPFCSACGFLFLRDTGVLQLVMNNGGTRLTNFVCSPLFLRPTSPVCGLVLPCYSIPRLLARCHLICAFEVETQLKYKNTKFESSAKTPFLVFSWVYTSKAHRRLCRATRAPGQGP